MRIDEGDLVQFCLKLPQKGQDHWWNDFIMIGQLHRQFKQSDESLLFLVGVCCPISLLNKPPLSISRGNAANNAPNEKFLRLNLTVLLRFTLTLF